MTRQLWALVGAVAIASVLDILFVLNGTDLTGVVKYTMLTNMVAVLVLVPVHQWICVREGLIRPDFVANIRNGMKAGAPAAVLLGLVTYLMIRFMAQGHIESRMLELTEALDASGITGDERTRRITSAQFIYSPVFHSTFVLLGCAITAFLSSVGSALMMRK